MSYHDFSFCHLPSAGCCSVNPFYWIKYYYGLIILTFIIQLPVTLDRVIVNIDYRMNLFLDIVHLLSSNLEQHLLYPQL